MATFSFLATLLLVLMTTGTFFPMTAAGPVKRFLFIGSYHPAFPTFPEQTDGLRSVFRENEVVLDSEFMDSKRLFTQENLDNFLGPLSYKLDNLPPYKAILTGDDNAL